MLIRLAALCLCLLPLPAFAQDPPQVITNTAFTVEASHNGVETVGYRLTVDGARVATLPVSARTAEGTIRFEGVTVAERGEHTLTVSAYNEDHEIHSAPLTIQAVRPAPDAPTDLRIILTVTIAPDGTVTLNLQR